MWRSGGLCLTLDRTRHRVRMTILLVFLRSLGILLVKMSIRLLRVLPFRMSSETAKPYGNLLDPLVFSLQLYGRL